MDIQHCVWINDCSGDLCQKGWLSCSLTVLFCIFKAIIYYMKKIFLLPAICLFFIQLSAQKIQTPDQIYGQLFKDVQMSRIFPDNKTFVDCTPKRKPAAIVADYLKIKNNPAIRFSLEMFVKENFDMPPAPPAFNYIQQEKDVTAHIKNLWGNLKESMINPLKVLPCWLFPIRILFPVAASVKFITGIHILPCWG